MKPKTYTTYLERSEIELKPWLGGLQYLFDPEYIDNSCVSEVSGFVVHSGLWRKDWALVLSNTYMDNLVQLAKSSVKECSE